MRREGIWPLVLAISLICGGCSDPLGPGSQRVFFRNHTSVAYQVRAQVDRLQTPVETRVGPGDAMDISLISLEDRGHLFVALFPEQKEGGGPIFADVELELSLDEKGKIDSVAIVALGESGRIDGPASALLTEELEIAVDFSSQLVLEAREFQDLLRVFVDNRTDSLLSVRAVAVAGDTVAVEVKKGLFPVSEVLPAGSADTVSVAIEEDWLGFQMEKDILLQVQAVSETVLDVRQILDLPATIRTGSSRVRYRLLSE